LYDFHRLAPPSFRPIPATIVDSFVILLLTPFLVCVGSQIVAATIRSLAALPINVQEWRLK
jgi:hypothetical protein